MKFYEKGYYYFLGHIIESVYLIEEYIKNKGKSDFLKSHQIQDSIIRYIEIFGEAVKNIPEDFKEIYPKITWKQIIGMQNILIHQYYGIDLDLT